MAYMKIKGRGRLYQACRGSLVTICLTCLPIMAAGASPPVFRHLAKGYRKHIPVMSQKGPRFVYVANFDSKTVSEYRIGPHGGLSPIGTIKAGSGPYRICTDPAGPYVYVLNRGTFTAAGSIYAYQVGR